MKHWKAKLRLFWGFCPTCNSDAPHLYDCPTCCYYQGDFPPSKLTKHEWWNNYLEYGYKK